MKSNRELRAFVIALKTSTCPDCLLEGITKVWPPEAMQFDHLPERGKKIATVMSFAQKADEQGLLLEIQKCEVVCANHHAIRTKKRGKSPETRLRMSIAQKISQNRPEVKALVSAAVKRNWNDSDGRKRKIEGMRRHFDNLK